MYEPKFVVYDKATGECIVSGTAPDCMKAIGIKSAWFHDILNGAENPKWKIKKSLMRYSVYDAKTELPVIVYGTKKECMKVMGIQGPSFSKALRVGAREKWIIIPEGYEDEE